MASDTLSIIETIGGTKQHEPSSLVDACIIEPAVSDPKYFRLDILKALSRSGFIKFLSAKNQPANGKERGFVSLFGPFFNQLKRKAEQPELTETPSPTLAP